jgi:hypothetical protein
VFVPGTTFQPGLAFVVYARAYLRWNPLKCAQPKSALLTNIRLGCEGLPGANTVAYIAALSVIKRKSFVTLTSDAKRRSAKPSRDRSPQLGPVSKRVLRLGRNRDDHDKIVAEERRRKLAVAEKSFRKEEETEKDRKRKFGNGIRFSMSSKTFNPSLPNGEAAK